MILLYLLLFILIYEIYTITDTCNRTIISIGVERNYKEIFLAIIPPIMILIEIWVGMEFFRAVKNLT